jgi:hypothetical protein
MMLIIEMGLLRFGRFGSKKLSSYSGVHLLGVSMTCFKEGSNFFYSVRYAHIHPSYVSSARRLSEKSSTEIIKKVAIYYQKLISHPACI